MDDTLRQYMSEIGKKGGKARLTKMTAAERKRIARAAAKASAKVRAKKAKARREKKNAR